MKNLYKDTFRTLLEAELNIDLAKDIENNLDKTPGEDSVENSETDALASTLDSDVTPADYLSDPATDKALQQQIEHKLPADGGNHSQPHKGQPGLPGISRKRYIPKQNVNQQQHGAEKIAESGIGNGRNLFSGTFPDKKIQGDHTGCRKRQNVSPQAFSADL